MANEHHSVVILGDLVGATIDTSRDKVLGRRGDEHISASGGDILIGGEDHGGNNFYAKGRIEIGGRPYEEILAEQQIRQLDRDLLSFSEDRNFGLLLYALHCSKIPCDLSELKARYATVIQAPSAPTWEQITGTSKIEDITYEYMLTDENLDRLNRELGFLATGKSNYGDFLDNLKNYGIPFSETQLRKLYSTIPTAIRSWNEATTAE